MDAYMLDQQLVNLMLQMQQVVKNANHTRIPTYAHV
jgi:hypothetical protein